MDDKVNYTAVGAFVLVLGAALVAAVLWLAAGLGGKQAMDAYQAVIQESVAGLNVDAPVKVLGVDVGKVSRIELDPQNSQQVRLHFLIARGTPIKRDSLAVLKTQGLTGIAYIELSGGSAASKPLRPGPDGVAPTIPFKLSLGARLENVLTNVLANVDRVSNNLNAVFDADNRAALKATLADLATVAHALAGQQRSISNGLADAARTAQLTARAGERMAPTLDRIASSAQSVETMADVARAAGGRAGVAADAAASAVQQLRSQTLPDLAQLMAELAALSASLRQLSEQTAGSPSSLLLGRPEPRPGPGERAAP
ncbi:Mammalian cell entry protein [Rubrivivax sp. A210]|uniref:MlaD family protein n=1 Tax=Rubrivivax sp. A210 TaxID=2772301 RepID=UPI001919B425|nr:MlaD family protein [Rubrivivax sp. A210]CAD5365976.1 Mammalian cell entry protein [Rubrivivax sp. A210]